MFEISGIKKIQKELVEAKKVLSEFDGELGSVNFDPKSPDSIELAILKVEQMVDDRIGIYSQNPFIGPLISEIKEKYRSAIFEKVAQTKSQGDF